MKHQPPRTEVNRQIYTSTTYPEEYAIPMHNEMSHTHKWPGKTLVFIAMCQPLWAGQRRSRIAAKSTTILTPPSARSFWRRGHVYPKL